MRTWNQGLLAVFPVLGLLDWRLVGRVGESEWSCDGAYIDGLDALVEARLDAFAHERRAAFGAEVVLDAGAAEAVFLLDAEVVSA
jgi:hypothetical protein